MSDLTDITNQVARGNDDRSDMNSQLNTIAEDVSDMSKDMKQLVNMLRGQGPASQSNFRNSSFGEQYQNSYGYNRNYGYNRSYGYGSAGNTNDVFGAARRLYGGNTSNFGRSNIFNRQDTENIRKGFLDSFEDTIVKGFFDADLKTSLNKFKQQFSDKLGMNLSDIPGKIGENLGKRALNSFKNSDFGKQFMPAWDTFKGKTGDIITEHGVGFLSKLTEGAPIREAFGELSGMGGELSGAFSELIGSAGGLASILPQVAIAFGAILVASKLLDTVFESLKLTVGAVKKMMEGLEKAGNRNETSREQNLKAAEQRMKDDYKTMIEQPFELLEKAANELYNSWNNNLTKISATQGYTKADVQDLMSVFAQRLRDEGLSSYVSGADLVKNLTEVINSGMSGKIAEEFAYQATVLGKAVPTQDFFQYAKTYASIAANAVRAGKSQEEAIDEANASIQSFANSLLYASRELSGGFSTGLTDAKELYTESAKIAQAAKSDNLTNISGVLLAIQSYVGAVAPDLADQLTSTIYKTLTGGNSSDIVALRSLAGVNASNTEFLQAFASNPQAIVSTMFENLANMYSESNAAYMEKAEGYSQLFGLSSEAFQRIDFADLADAIRNMNVSSNALEQNMDLLMQGQTTTTAEQLKAQQINQYMIEEGLAYVIDNEAAQIIQQHMWQEQQTRELQESTYSVELQGTAMEALQMLEHAVNNIVNFLNPFAWFKKLGNIISTSAEGAAQSADIRQMLELGKVGEGNAKSLYQLTTLNQDLNATQSLVELLGGTSAYEAAKSNTQLWNRLSNSFYTAVQDSRNSTRNEQFQAIADEIAASADYGVSSQYSWGGISKSRGAAAAALLNAAGATTAQRTLTDVTTAAGTSAASASANAVKESVDKMLEDSYLVDQFVKQGKSYEEWVESGSKYGISDMSEALSTAGYSETDIRQYFQDKETEQGMEESHNIREEEKVFRDTGIQFWTVDFVDFKNELSTDIEDLKTNYLQVMIDKQTTMIENQETLNTDMNTNHTSLIKNQEDWYKYFKDDWVEKGWTSFISSKGDGGLFNKLYNEFMKYFINHEYYSKTEGYSYKDVTAVQEQKDAKDRGDTVYALAEMLTKNIVDLQDPTMQTNALLGQILIVVKAIMEQNNSIDSTASANGTSLAESLSALALGLSSGSSDTTSTIT